MKPGNEVAVEIVSCGAIIYATNMVPEFVGIAPQVPQSRKDSLIQEAVAAYEKKRRIAAEKWIDNFNGVVHIADFWDRSPCMWFCDLSQLDDSDPIQKTYKNIVREAMKNSTTMNKNEEKPNGWYLPGSAALHGFGGRPDEVKHAVVYPPCNVEASVLIYYP